MSHLPEYVPGADRLDRLYDLLPAHIRAEDQLAGEALRALLRVVNGQANVVEDDIERLYENWFVETCDLWAIPYLTSLAGLRPLPQPLPAARDELDTPRGRRRLALLTPRREAANTLAHRRRKGTLAVLEDLARDVTGWPARAFEFRERTAHTQHLKHPRTERGRLADLRNAEALARGNGPFGTQSRLVDVRRAGPVESGRGRVGDIGLHVWTRRVLRVDRAPVARATAPFVCHPTEPLDLFTFSVLGHPVQLYSRPILPSDPMRQTTEWEIPLPIAPQALGGRTDDFYGPGKSFQVWERGKEDGKIALVERNRLRVVDLSRPEKVRLGKGKVGVDPVLGLLARGKAAGPELLVTYHYAAAANLGGGDYYRRLKTACRDCVLYVRQVHDADENEDDEREKDTSAPEGSRANPFVTLDKALDDRDKNRATWLECGRPRPVIIEILDDARYEWKKPIEIKRGESLEIRAGQGRRPLLVPPESKAHVECTEKTGKFALNGLLIAERPLMLKGPFTAVDISHCTLVPGSQLDSCWLPCFLRKNRPVLCFQGLKGRLTIRRSIAGSISLERHERRPRTADRAGLPPLIAISDSVLDNAGGCCPALGGTGPMVGFAQLRIERCTVLGRVEVHAIDLAQDCIFRGRLVVARRRQGCVRFCYVEPGSPTPPKYRCQPESDPGPSPDCQTKPRDAAIVPRFLSRRYGTADYLTLSSETATEILRGASDQSEMGVYHDRYLAQRKDNLQARVEGFEPAGAKVQLFFDPY